MRFALCLRGISDQFMKSYENLKTMVINDLRANGCTVDIFLNTYKTGVHEELIQCFQPVCVSYNEFTEVPFGESMYSIVPKQILQCCELVKDHNNHYDYIIITRFDLTFNKCISQEVIYRNTINMECLFVPDLNSGDNFILFPFADLSTVATSIMDCIENKDNSHQLWRYFELRGLKCHYIGGETGKRNPHYDVMFRFTRYLTD